MSSANPYRVSGESNQITDLLKQIQTIQDNESEYLRLLHEVIEYVDSLFQSMMPLHPQILNQFQTLILPALIEIMNKKPPQMINNVRHKVRRQTLEVILVANFPDDPNQFPGAKIVALLMDVLMLDNEENAEIALKILQEMIRFYKNSWDALASHYQVFFNYCSLLYRNLPEKLEELKKPEESKSQSLSSMIVGRAGEGVGAGSQEQLQLVPSVKSMKNIIPVTTYLVSLNSYFDLSIKPYLQSLLQDIFDSIFSFPDQILNQVVQMKVYMDYLDILKNTLSFFTFIHKKSFLDEILFRFPDLIDLQFKMLKNCPQHGQQIRKDILHMIKYEITEIFSIEQQDVQKNNNSRQEIYLRRNEALTKHLDDFLDLKILFGQGKVSKELQFHARTLLCTYIKILKETAMNEQQKKKSLQVIIRVLLDPSITIGMRGSLVFMFHRKYVELYSQSLAEKTCSPHCELQLEVLEALITIIKDLDPQIAVARQDLSTMKYQIGDLKKKSKRWLVDIEQRDINFKELFLQDDYQYFEIGRQAPLDVDKIRAYIQSSIFFDSTQLDYKLQTPTSLQAMQQNEINRERQRFQPYLHMDNGQLQECLDFLKEGALRLVRNLIAMIDQVLLNIQEIRRTQCYRPPEMKLLKKLLVHGSHLIQNLYEMFSNTQAEKEKAFELIKRLAKIFQRMQVLQFRDLFTAADDHFFGLVLEVKATKGDSGVYYFADYLMTFSQPNPNVAHAITKQLDDQTAYLLEIFFNYINEKMRIFNKTIDQPEGLLSLNKFNRRLARIPNPDLQSALQLLTLAIGQKALQKRNDLRMKNLFFSVFVYCIKYTKSSQIIPYYYSVIRDLFKELNIAISNENSSANPTASSAKEFIPLIQGLLETFLQAREEATLIKETNEICYSVPAKLKNLIEYLPIISKPLVDTLKSQNVTILESGFSMIQIWANALTNYPEILDPVIDTIISDLKNRLFRILIHYGYLTSHSSIFKMIAKLGAKTRVYNEDKEFKTKNYPEDGLKFDLEDRSSGSQVTLCVDAAIDVILLKLFDNFSKYSSAQLMEAYKLIKSAFICFVDADIDMDYVVASVHNAKVKNTELLTQYHLHSTKYFDAKKAQLRVSQLGKASEQHVFEKILKCLLLCCSFPKANAETLPVLQKVRKFLAWVAQYFTLVYLSKNGKLRENLVGEISPLLFLENICEFLYYNMIEGGVPKSQSQNCHTYHKGSTLALKTMLRTLKQLYGEDDDSVYENLDFIQFIIQKVSHLAYGQDIHKKVAANKALQIIIRELPKRVVKLYWQTLIDSVFHIVNVGNEPLTHLIESECKATISAFFTKIGIYESNLLESADQEEREFNAKLLDRLLMNLYQTRVSSRTVTIYFVELIAKRTNCSVKQILAKVNCNNLISLLLQQQMQQMQQMQQQQPGAQPQVPRPQPITAAQIIAQNDVSWLAYLTQNQVEFRAKNIYSLYKGGYSSILSLMTYLDLIDFLMKHNVLEPMRKLPTYLFICEQLIRVLEDQILKQDNKPRDLSQSKDANGNIEQPQPGSAQALAADHKLSNASKAAVKYMIQEKQYLSYNKTYDPYSHTMHTHSVLQSQHFEVEETARRDKVNKETQEQFYDNEAASYYFFEIFEKRNFDNPNPKSTQVMNAEEYQQFSNGLKLRINSFISTLFSQMIKASDVSFDYVHHIYEIFPNHRLHTELIVKCLHILSQLSTGQEELYQFFKQRKQAFFEVGVPQAQDPAAAVDPQPQSMNPNLNRRIDLYAVELKSRMIAIYFKFFQREEQNVYKQAKRCLKKILRREPNQQDALPNVILKECVRPSLNILSLKGSFPALYEQLAKLVNVLHGCFNNQLSRHLIRCYEQNKAKINEDFVLSFSTDPQAQLSSDYMPQDKVFQPDPNLPMEQQQMLRQQKFREDYERLLSQQNQKIEELEIANYIIRFLYLLPTERSEILRILIQIPDFEFQVHNELEKRFEEAYQRICDYYNVHLQIPHEQSIRPISIKLGALKSDFIVGLSKYFNKMPLEAVSSFQNLRLMPVMLEIMKQPESYGLRERTQRETEFIRQIMGYEVDSATFDMALSLVCIFQKYNRGYLALSSSFGIVEKLLEKWNELGDYNLDRLLVRTQGSMNQFRNQAHFREVYGKIEKCLLVYCRHPDARLSAVFGLICGYRYQSIVDMTNVKLFFMYEVPYLFSLPKKKLLLEKTLKEIQFGNLSEVSKIMIFELAFMPSLVLYGIKGNEQQQQFKELVDEKLIESFTDTFFGSKLVESQEGPIRVQQLESLRQKLEVSSVVSYEQFQIDIIKVTNLMFRYFDFITIQRVCMEEKIQKISQFLYSCSKKANNAILKEWAFYTLTSLFVMILDVRQYEQRQNRELGASDGQILQMIAQSTDQVLIMIMQHQPLLHTKALVHKSFRNIMNICGDPQVKELLPISQSMASQQIDYVSHCLKRALIFDGRNSNNLIYLSSFLLGHSEQFFYTHEIFLNKMIKIINRFVNQYFTQIYQKQVIVELSYTIIQWINSRMLLFQRQGQFSESQIQTYQLISRNLLYLLIRTSVMTSQSDKEPMKEVLDLCLLCNNQIKSLVRTFPNQRIEFPFFAKLMQQQEPADKENIQVTKLVILNVAYILLKYQRQTSEFRTFFLDYIVPSVTKLQKGIILACKILLHCVSVAFQSDPNWALTMQDINAKLRGLIAADLQKSTEEAISQTLQKSLEMERVQQKPLLPFQEMAWMHILPIVPHLTIRVITTLETVQEQAQAQLKQAPPAQLEASREKLKSLQMFEDEFKFYKELASTLFRIVGSFRKYLVLDQIEAKKQLPAGSNVVAMHAHCGTVYTPPIEFQPNSQPSDFAELKIEELNHDMFNKETVMMGVLHITKKLKKMSQEQAFQIYEILQYIVYTLVKHNTNEYMIEWVRRVVDVLIEDDQGDQARLLMDQKAQFIIKMLLKIVELQPADRPLHAGGQGKEAAAQTNVLVERIYEQAVRFLEKQSNVLLQESCQIIFEKLFLNLRGKSRALKERVFRLFEKNSGGGSSVFRKLQFFFAKKSSLADNAEKVLYFQAQSQLLDFTLFNFRSDEKLAKSRHSSKLLALRNDNIQFEKDPDFERTQMENPNSEYRRVVQQLAGFKNKLLKFKKLTMKSIMDPLSEIISINPIHNTDKNITDKLLVKIFYQYWAMLSREEQQSLSEQINQYLLSLVPFSNQDNVRRNLFPKTLLECLATLTPQIRLEPEVLQYLGKNLNLWHSTIPILENHLTLYPRNERYVLALSELYTKLSEEDYLAGLRRLATDAKETKVAVSYGQHHMWEELNQQFNHFIIFHAEEQGLYKQMDSDSQLEGKYQRQIQLNTFYSLRQSNRDLIKKSIIEQQRASGVPEPMSEEQMAELIRQEDKKVDEEVKRIAEEGEARNRLRPKLNISRFRELDLRVWDTLFIESLKYLSKWDQYRDIGHAMQNQEIQIEAFWNIKDWRNLSNYEGVLKKSDSIRYQIYYIYLIIQQQQLSQFDEAFKQVINNSIREWDQHLPNYLDSVQLETLGLFQLAMETSEGGRNLVKDVPAMMQKNKLGEIKNAMNIWRERVPNKCESILLWKDLLENRSFIQNQIASIVVPSPEDPNQRQQHERALAERNQFINEYLDIPWNYYKLAQISRKHGLPQLAYTYLQTLRKQLSFSGDSEGTKYESFRFYYEELKLNLQYNANPKSLDLMVKQFEDSFSKLIQSGNIQQQQEPWQTAELHRLLGEYHFKAGNPQLTQKHLTESLALNKKEARTWLAYARLNALVFDHKRSEAALLNCLKGYMCGITLDLPKCKQVIPQMIKFLKRKDINGAAYQQVIQFVKSNLDQMPTWIWLFWIPQLLQICYSYQNSVEYCLAAKALEKISKQYPQSLFYQLKLRQPMEKTNDANAQRARNIDQYFKSFLKNIQNCCSMAVLNCQEKISNELTKVMKLSIEEDLYQLLCKVLQINTFIFNTESNLRNDLENVFQHILSKYLREENSKNAPQILELRGPFIRDFLSESAEQRDIDQTIHKLKNLKNFLHRRLVLTEQKTKLEQISPYLANFNEKGVELHGQYLLIDSEPLPQNTIYIQRFEPTIYRSGSLAKKLTIKGSNSKVYGFTVSFISNKEEYSKHLQDEKVLQVKAFANILFNKHKETARRGIKFFVPIKCLMSRCKLSQEDQVVGNLQEIHDHLLQERGFDSELAFNLQLKKAEEAIKEIPEGTSKLICNLSMEKKNQIIRDTYYEMKNIYCQPYLLTSFFHRIFYTVDELFIFKKQFTHYHAVNSFFSYIFTQAESASLNHISFCKSSGRVIYSDTKMSSILNYVGLRCNQKSQQLQQQQQPNATQSASQAASTAAPVNPSPSIQNLQLNRQEIEAIEKSELKLGAYLPFRLTNNIAEFIGKVGVLGPFAGTMTSCSLALSKYKDKFMPLLFIIFSEDLASTTHDSARTPLINSCCEYVKYKIESLSQNKDVIQYGQLDPQYFPNSFEAEEAKKNELEDSIKIGQFLVPKSQLRFDIEKPVMFEEFNKKVFELIDMAQEDSRLSQVTHNYWNAWF